jgi:hypothetical protein
MLLPASHPAVQLSMLLANPAVQAVQVLQAVQGLQLLLLRDKRVGSTLQQYRTAAAAAVQHCCRTARSHGTPAGPFLRKLRRQL